MSGSAFEIPTDPKYIRQASAKVLDSLKGLDVDEGTLFDVRLSVEEAIINAIKYGNKFNKDLPVSIKYSLEGDKLEVTVRDRGKGFSHTSFPDPTSNNNILKQGGRGLFLIRTLMDEVKFSDSGNEIKMVKFLKGGKGHGCKG
ncbi:MAG: ATP-binding protein [Candidatus Omnitrophota bacterium]